MNDQAIENQNIFDLLGARSLSAAEEADFLDRLQKTIWDDFLDNNVELLLTDEEVEGLIAIINRGDVNDDEKQSLMLEYMQKLIPDLDEILLEKASKLKKDLTMERIASLEEMYREDEGKMRQLIEVRKLVEEERWMEVADTLNLIG